MSLLSRLFSSERSRLLRDPVTTKERGELEESCWQARVLGPSHQDQLIRWSRVFIAEKNWEGCDGLEITTEMKRVVAATAGLMVLAYPEWYFDRTKTILMYPRPYVARVAGNGSNGSVGGEFHRAGETIYGGPIVLNWRDIEHSRHDTNGGNHLVIHEFAHQLDMINGPIADGLPPLPSAIDQTLWAKRFRAEYETAREMVAQGYRVLINDYGLVAESEFFAVASEYYFQLPDELGEYHPNVYSLLKEFYITDTRELLS